MNALAEELRGIRDRRWNSERFIVFQTVTLQIGGSLGLDTYPNPA